MVIPRGLEDPRQLDEERSNERSHGDSARPADAGTL
jgi:hypothetical protein